MVQPTVPEEDQAEADSEEHIAEEAEPVRGGVMWTGDYDEEDYDGDDDGTDGGYDDDVGGDSEGDHIAGSDPEEGEHALAPIEEAEYSSPEYQTDYQGMMHQYADRILELTQERADQAVIIAHLEEQNQTHQQMEDRYRDVAHEKAGEVRELRQQLELSEARILGLQTDREALQAQLSEMPTEWMDGMGSTAEDIIEGLTERNEELEVRVQQLEIERQTQQELKDQYRDAAHQLLHEVEILTEGRIADGQHMLQLGEQVVQAEGIADGFRAERDAARAELQAVRDELALAEAARDFFHESWVTSANKADELEEEVRTVTARMDTAGFALDTAMGRLRSRIRRFPREEDMSRQEISRRIVDRIARQEHEDAARRMDQ